MSHGRIWRWEISRFDFVKTRIKIGQWEGKQQEPVVDHPPILNPRIIYIALLILPKAIMKKHVSE